MATVTMNYSAAQTVTLTMQSLANTSYRQSAVVDNASNKFVDALIGGSVQVHSTAPTANTTIEFYAYGTFDGTNYTGGCTGSDAAYDVGGDANVGGEEDELKLVDVVTVDATTSQDYVWGPTSVAAAFGGVLPSKWGIVVKNSTGQILHATGTNNITKFIGVKYDVA